MRSEEHSRRAVIFANGILTHWPPGFEIATENDLLVAADGGLMHCLKRGIRPHVLVGDLDSVAAQALSAAEAGGVEIIRFSKHKDETDLQLALHVVLKRNIREIVILGGLGRRWDMTLSNVLLLASPMLQHARVTLLHGRQVFCCVHGGQHVEVDGGRGDLVSLMPLVQDAVGVTLSGFEYPLNSETLSVGTTRGISNVVQDPPARIHIREGILLVVVSRRGRIA